MRRYKIQNAPHPGAHPLVKLMWQEMHAQRASQMDVSERSGVSAGAMRKWRFGQRGSPRLWDIEAVLNTLGYDLIARRRND